MKISPLESMTGFGHTRVKIGSNNYTCSIRSLNHRFLDVKIRLPRSDLHELEMMIRKKVSESFYRGSIELTINIESQKTPPLINEKQAQAYASLGTNLSRFFKKYGVSLNLTLDSLLKLPGVLEADTTNHYNYQEIVNLLITPAVLQLKKSRKQEGEKLQKHLLKLLAQLQKGLAEIKKLETKERQMLHESLKKRMIDALKLFEGLRPASLSAVSPEFTNRLKEEAAFLLERRDFEEERVRLEMHLTKVYHLITKEQHSSVGRKLDFFQQELLREVNTLGTKAQSEAVTNHAIEMKSIIERFKEQASNVE